MDRADVVIIGAGAIGISTAHYLSKTTTNIIVVERGEICSGCSYGNAGLLVPSHCVPLAEPKAVAQGFRWMFSPDSPFYIKPRLDRDLISWLWRFVRAANPRQVAAAMPLIRDLSLESLRLYEELAMGLDFGLRQNGAVYLCRTQQALAALTAESNHIADVGLQVEVLSAEEIQALQPDVRFDVVGGVRYPQDGHIDPALFVNTLATHAIEAGVDVRTQTEVLGFDFSGSELHTVRTTRGDIQTEQVVLAGGAWSPGLTDQLDLDLPIQPAKGYSVTVRRPEKTPDFPVMLAEAKIGVNPMGETLRFAGTLELAGLDHSINARRVQAILDALPRYLPDLDPEKLELLEIWRGFRPCTPDGLPFLGRSKAHPNLTVAAGHAMIGISLAPVTGKIAAAIVSGEDSGFDLSLVGVDRFA
jgi:D-amino-acid dehydrogenase